MKIVLMNLTSLIVTQRIKYKYGSITTGVYGVYKTERI